jgi:hypothetical protein
MPFKTTSVHNTGKLDLFSDIIGHAHMKKLDFPMKPYLKKIFIFLVKMLQNIGRKS